MTPAAFIDANIPIYASGRANPYKEACTQVLMMAAERPRAFVTDVEVLQELLHRYLALRLWPLGREVLRGFAEVMRGRIEPVYVNDIELAMTLADGHPTLPARDLLHVAVMRRLGTNRIITADADFDRIPAMVRLDPTDIRRWSGPLLASEA